MSVSGWRGLRSNAVPVRVFFLCCALGLGAWAAEEPVTGDEQLPADEQEIDAGAEAGIETAEAAEDENSESTNESPGEESPDIFIPSEDISENIAVKFPVDI